MKPILTSLQGRIARALIAILLNENNHKLDRQSESRELPVVIVESVESTHWESLTFIGSKHRLALRIMGLQSDNDIAINRLSTNEIRLNGHIIAEMRVTICPTNSSGAEISIVVHMLTVVDF